MTDFPSDPPFDRPAIYQISIQGRLDDSWVEWFEDMTMAVEKDEPGRTMTVLTGPIRDQSALYGLLARLRDLGLTLIAVHRREADEEEKP